MNIPNNIELRVLKQDPNIIVGGYSENGKFIGTSFYSKEDLGIRDPDVELEAGKKKTTKKTTTKKTDKKKAPAKKTTSKKKSTPKRRGGNNIELIQSVEED